jgi:hypothetical protein
MKKTRILLAAALMVAAAGGAFASKTTLLSYFYFAADNPSNPAQPTAVNPNCQVFDFGCVVNIPEDGGALHQLYAVDPSDSQLKAVKP